MGERAVVPLDKIERHILLIRGEKVLLDSDLAEMYGVPTKALNQAVKRNLERFPKDFMFQLTWEESENLRSQFVTLDAEPKASRSRSQSVTSKRGGNRKYRPYAFTEQGVAMLSSVLHSPRAVQVNVQIMRTFVRLRQILSSNAGLSAKLDALEQKYDEQFKIVFDAIRALMEEHDEELNERKRKKIGYHSEV
jgi:hypothetical protein